MILGELVNQEKQGSKNRGQSKLPYVFRTR